MVANSLSFAFRPELGETPETLAKRREVAEALLGTASRVPRNTGEGLNALGAAIGGRLSMNRIGRAESAGRAGATDAFNGLFGGAGEMMSGDTGGSMSAPAPIGGGDFATMASSVIPRLAQDLGITPEQAAGIVGQLGHESEGLKAINERNPVVPGSRGGFGWAQWTGPRRKAFERWAADNNLDVTSPDANYGYLLHELKDTPEGRVLDQIRKAPDAVTAGRMFTEGFLRPGIPNQPSRDKWTQRALAAIGNGGGGQAAVADALIGNTGGDALTGGGGTPPANAPIRVAQSGPSQEQLLQVLANPWLSDQQRGIAELLLKQQMEQADPMKRLQMEKLGLEVGNLRNPPVTNADRLAREKFDWDKQTFGQTSDIKEYEYAKSQGYTGSFTEYQEAVRKAGAAQSTVTVGGEKIPEKVLQAGIDASDQADVLESQVQELSIFRDMASEADTGWSTPITLPLKQAFRSIGLDVAEDVPLLEAMQAQQNQMALRLRNPESGFGLTGNTSNQDVRFLKDAVAGIEKTPAGNRAVLTIMMAKQRREAMLARAKADYIFEKGSLAGWGAEKKKLIDSAPFFEPGEKELLASLKRQPAANGAPAVGAVQGGYRFKGGDPADKNNWEPVMSGDQFDQRFGG